MYQAPFVVAFSLAACGLALGQDHKQPLWLKAPWVEQAVRIADAAFLADIEWYSAEQQSWNKTIASGRILPRHAVWGDLPGAPIDTGPQQFMYWSGSKGMSLWDNLVLEPPIIPGSRTAVVFLSSGTGAEFELVHLVALSQDNPVRQAEDLAVLRELEFAPDTPELRERLIQAVISHDSTELLCLYAVRRLHRLEDDIDRQFDLVLDPRIQKSAPYTPRIGPSGDRLSYAVERLRGYTFDREQDEYRPRTPGELRHVYARLLDAFVNAPSEYMARTVMMAFGEQQARKAGFTEQEWDDIRQQIRSAIVENPEHPIHKVAPDMREIVNEQLESLLHEPNLLGAPGSEPGEE